jgi:hypothetical protein
MSNTLLTSDNIAAVAAKLVGSDLGLAGTIYRDLDNEFNPGGSNVVKIRVPGAVASQTRGIRDTATPLVTDEITEQSIPVTLSQEIYDSILLSAGTLDLDLVDFSTQVLVPQTTAIVRHVERAVASAMTATPASDLAFTEASPALLFTLMRKQLRNNGVTADTPLRAVVGSDVYGALLDGPAGTWDADGKVRGFEVIESTRIASDEAIGYIRDAWALVVRAPQVPQGAPFGASVRTEDFALRHVRSFDGSVNADRSTVSAFVAVAALPLAVDNEDGSVTLTPNHGAVRVQTAG